MIHRIITRIILCSLIVSLGGCLKSSSPTSPYFDRLVYVAMGASDAVGIGAYPLENGYVYKIRDGLEQRANTVELYNLGVSGKRISYIENTELPFCLTRHPDVVTLWAGPNDIIHGTSVEAFEASLANIFLQLRQSATAVVVMANVPDMTQIPRFLLEPDPDVTIQRIAAFNDVITRQTDLHAIPLVDLFGGGYASDWSNISLDGFHPSNTGYARLAELYLEIILSVL